MQTQKIASRVRASAREKTLAFFNGCGGYQNSESRLFQGPVRIIRAHFSDSNVGVNILVILVILVGNWLKVFAKCPGLLGQR